MHKGITKKLSLLLAGFFAFSYQLANYTPTTSEYKTVGATSNYEVILGGQSIGVNINVEGIMILGFSDFYGEDGKKHCPAKEAGLKESDVIVSVNENAVTSATEFANVVDQCSDTKMNICYKRGQQTLYTALTPVKSADDGKYHLGLWARDGTTGIGTLTFIDPITKGFGALGHGVTDADTGELIITGKGNIYYSSINGVEKGCANQTGELQGYFISSEIGDICSNTEYGIFGNFNENFDYANVIPVASRQEIATGEAVIYCCIDGNDVEQFAINIEKVNINSTDNKSMVIRITDERLITRTGGIVQGMSGSPIVQNGKLIGAVTHVFVNDSTKGYGIFIENMLKEID